MLNHPTPPHPDSNCCYSRSIPATSRLRCLLQMRAIDSRLHAAGADGSLSLFPPDLVFFFAPHLIESSRYEKVLPQSRHKMEDDSCRSCGPAPLALLQRGSPVQNITQALHEVITLWLFEVCCRAVVDLSYLTFMYT